MKRRNAEIKSRPVSSSFNIINLIKNVLTSLPEYFIERKLLKHKIKSYTDKLPILSDEVTKLLNLQNVRFVYK